MTVTVLFAAKPESWADYAAPLRAAFAEEGLDAALVTEAAPETVDYIVYAPSSGLEDFRPFTRLKAVLNLWAGVEDVVGNPTLTVPLARMVDDAGLTQGMVEWVTGHVLRHHLGMDRHILGQDGVWRRGAPPLATERRVAILGLGAIEERPVVREGADGASEVVPAPTLPLSLSIDHRVVDGAVAAEFANTVMEHLENPLLLLNE